MLDRRRSRGRQTEAGGGPKKEAMKKKKLTGRVQSSPRNFFREDIRRSHGASAEEVYQPSAWLTSTLILPGRIQESTRRKRAFPSSLSVSVCLSLCLSLRLKHNSPGPLHARAASVLSLAGGLFSFFARTAPKAFRPKRRINHRRTQTLVEGHACRRNRCV